jgi:hypothetical protein
MKNLLIIPLVLSWALISAQTTTSSFTNGSTKVLLYPNPGTDVLHIQPPIGNTPARIDMYDVTGKLVKSYADDWTVNNGVFKLTVSDLTPGVYLIDITYPSSDHVVSKWSKDRI